MSPLAAASRPDELQPQPTSPPTPAAKHGDDTADGDHVTLPTQQHLTSGPSEVLDKATGTSEQQGAGRHLNVAPSVALPSSAPHPASDLQHDGTPSQAALSSVRTEGLGIAIPSRTSTCTDDAPSSNPSPNSRQDTRSLPPPPPPKDEKYLTRMTITSTEMQEYGDHPATSGAKNLEQDRMDDPAEDMMDDSRSEIQSIMDQFEDGMGGPGEDEIMSPRLEKAGPMFSSPQAHPPRKSSLERLSTAVSGESDDTGRSSSAALQSPPQRVSSLASLGSATSARRNSASQDLLDPSLAQQTSRNLPPPPQPDPESDLPFDFHRFLEQLRHRTADPVAKFLRSFLLEFGKRQWMVHEQVKIIGDFLEFISKKMAQCEVWKNVSDPEFDNAREGMEKLVMNRLYTQTFSPAIPASNPVPGAEAKRKASRTPAQASRHGRRGQHQEDVERDEVLAQKVRIYGWVKEEHLDIGPIGDKGRKFMVLAQQELVKIRSYRAPRDKVICILNCCKVIFGFLRNAQHDQSADSFIPLLIYTVLKANPDHLVSNVQYILRFRNQDKLGGEAGYYISSLMGAIQFIENLDRTSLTIADEDFEKNVEAAVSAIAEGHDQHQPPQLPSHSGSVLPPQRANAIADQASPSPSHGLNRQRISDKESVSQGDQTKTNEHTDDNAAVSGLLRTIQRPLSTIGRIFSDDSTNIQEKPGQPAPPPVTPQPGSSSTTAPESRGSYLATSPSDSARQQHRVRRQHSNVEDAAARQASAEAEEARKIREREEGHVVETLCGMFPSLDKDVILDVVRANEGRVGSAVDACLALSS